MQKTPIRAAIAAATLMAGLAAHADPMINYAESSAGDILVDAKGMALYTFDKDSGGMSACYGTCAEKWPPVLASASDKPTGDYGLTKRNDGAMQWTYEGMPLYTWINDKAPGDVTGDGVGGVWHLARPN